MKTHFVNLGPQIPVVPVSHFKKYHLSREEWELVWSICGPSVQRNMHQRELWQVIAAAYVEGLLHGSEYAEMKKEKIEKRLEK